MSGSGDPMLKKTNYETSAKCPLDGIRILDLSRVIAGNVLTGILADFGAEVIKIEKPTQGDDLRKWLIKGVDTYWKIYSRNKKSVTLNLRHEKGVDILRKLIDDSDVLVENFRPGTLEAMGLEPERLWARNPKLVVVRISGWGQDGPFRDRPGFGTLIEALSGFAAMNTSPDGTPMLPPLPLADQIAGLYGATATMVAVRAVEASGAAGQVIDLPLFDPLFSILGPLAADFRLTGQTGQRPGAPNSGVAPRNIYPTKDGKYVALSAPTQTMFERLMRALEMEEFIHDPRFLTNHERSINSRELDQIIAERINQQTLEENLEFFKVADITVGQVADISDLIDHQLIRDRNILSDFPDEIMGGIPMHNIPARLSSTPGRIRSRAPQLGEHTAEILGKLGFQSDDLRELTRDGTI